VNLLNPFNQGSDIPVITIDGPSGTGKGTIAKKLSLHLGFHYLDSGAIYRVLTLAVLEAKLALDDVDNIVWLAHNLSLHFKNEDIFLGDRNVTDFIRGEAIDRAISYVALIPEVREALFQKQRAFKQAPGLVTDGRDMGTVIFPEANLKIFMIASAAERAQRRFLQHQQKGLDIAFENVLHDIEARDKKDSSRAIAPLKPAVDAITVDTTGKNIAQVFEEVLALWKV
jgi:cytidylate kinase